MSTLPMLRAKQLVRILEQLGFELVRQKGSHARLRHPDGRAVPVHPAQDIGRGLLRKILRDAEISSDDLQGLLNK